MTALEFKLKPRILLAEDEKHLATGICYNLEKRGLDVLVTSRGDQALEVASREGFDLIILDVMMPGLDGFEVCKSLRSRNVLTPILMLTARHETENRIKGITLGADDYLGKPFHLEELLARAEALLRRRRWDDETSTHEKSRRESFELGEAIFDSNRLLIKGPTGEVTLTAIEARLLHLFVTEPGRTFTRAQILKKVWGFHEDTQTRTLDNFIMRLRNHIQDVGGASELIASVRGVGYRLEPKIQS